MNRRHPILPVLAFAVLTLAVAACGPTGALGTVPPVPRTPTPSVDPGPPDLTPEPSSAPTPTATPASTPSGDSAETPAPTATPTQGSADTMVIRAYYVLDGDVGVEGLVPTLREVPKTTAVARAAVETLLRGQTLADYDRLATAIPAGTRLLGLTIKDGVATVDLSREFESGGGSASAFRRLGQVVYTLTQFSSVRSVLFQVEGRTVTTFGSEGIVLEGPQARDDFVDILPSIFVDRPAYGAAAGNPARVTGNADVFEATFRIAILDGGGHKLADQQVMATCGTGCRGTFDVTVRYDVAKAQWGTLRTYFGSAKDGTPTDIRDYPVWLTPAD
ncbi:MAG TPA: GerMN domain-containing protein [Methylomirabilota bacterium]|nr:GerMN domain-containing protein [Methylomirabilota bacterium]